MQAKRKRDRRRFVTSLDSLRTPDERRPHAPMEKNLGQPLLCEPEKKFSPLEAWPYIINVLARDHDLVHAAYC